MKLRRALQLMFALTAAACLMSCTPASARKNIATPTLQSSTDVPVWTAQELATIQSLSLANLPPLPPSESNRYADREDAARLGQKLFFDARLSANGKVSCATCHQPKKDFTDGLPVGVGVAPVARHTMTVVGSAYSPWLFWDGRADSLWSQALGPLEDASEHGGTRTQYARLLASSYREEYDRVFSDATPWARIARLPAAAGPLGDVDELRAWEQMSESDREAVNRVFANIGKAMDAYQRRLIPRKTRFDEYVFSLIEGNRKKANTLMSVNEQNGLKLFVGAADCIHCHNGPLLSNNDFHNTGIAAANESTLAEGRARGVHRVRHAEFNCLGKYSDADENECMELQYVKAQGSELMSAFRTPGLRNVAQTPPYMHHGRLQTLDQVVAHYNTAPPSALGRSELIGLALSDLEQAQLVAFLTTLDTQPETQADTWRIDPGRDTQSSATRRE